MRLNLPILEHLKNSQNILIAGAGGGFDVFSGLPIYFTLRQMGKTVHLANYSFCEFKLVQIIGNPDVVIDGFLLRARGEIKHDFMYYPEGYLSQWFKKEYGENVEIWMFAKTGVKPLVEGYKHVVEQLNIDAIILVDGGVDSLMRGDEQGAGTLVAASISLAAVDAMNVSVKILACIGFGTEFEEEVCHYLALENMAALAKRGAFYGSCALTPQMEAFQLYETACRYVWEQPDHHKSHISTRIIPAVHGEFGMYLMYPDSNHRPVFTSPLMSLYWFFDANTVVKNSLIMDVLRNTNTLHEAFHAYTAKMSRAIVRQRQSIPY